MSFPGRGTSRMAGGWVRTPTIQLFTTILVVGSYTDRPRNTVFKIQRGVRTPYPQAGPFPLPGGHKFFCPSLKGKGDRCASAQWGIGFYTDHTTLYYHSGGRVLTLTLRVTPSLKGREVCEPPTRQGGPFPPFPPNWETPLRRLRRGGHKAFCAFR